MDQFPPNEVVLTHWQHGFRHVRDRILEGLIVSLPILITLWVIWWIFTTIEFYAIDPLASWVIWKVLKWKSTPEVSHWFEEYGAPVIAIILALAFLYFCGTLAHSQAKRAFDRYILRIPLVSQIYDAVKSVMDVFNRPKDQSAPQRVVLVGFPHPGMRVPAIVTSTCKDVSTDKTLICVYVPTTPVPTSGYFIMVPEEDVTELNWDVQQTLQAIISGGLTVPGHVTYYGTKLMQAAVKADPNLKQASPVGPVNPPPDAKSHG